MNSTIGFLDHKNIDLDTKIIILGGLVHKLLSHTRTHELNKVNAFLWSHSTFAQRNGFYGKTLNSEHHKSITNKVK